MRNIFVRISDKHLKDNQAVYSDEVKLVTELRKYWKRHKLTRQLIDAYNECLKPKRRQMKRLMPALSIEHSMGQVLGRVNDKIVNDAEKSILHASRDAFKQIAEGKHASAITVKDMDTKLVKQNVMRINQQYVALGKLNSKLKKLEAKGQTSEFEMEQKRHSRDRITRDICSDCEQFLTMLLVQNAKPVLYQVMRDINTKYCSMISAYQRLVTSSISISNSDSVSGMNVQGAPMFNERAPTLVKNLQQQQQQQQQNSKLNVDKSSPSDTQFRSPDYCVALCDYEGDSLHIPLHEGEHYSIIKNSTIGGTTAGQLAAVDKETKKKGLIKEDLVEFL